MLDSIYFLLALGFFFVLLLMIYTFNRLAKGWSLQILFKDFRRKIWMTVSLGSLFFSFYLLLIGLGIYIIPYWRTEIFLLLYHYPLEFIYGGLWIFACFSLSIYLARMFIKYIYMTKGKDS